MESKSQIPVQEQRTSTTAKADGLLSKAQHAVKPLPSFTACCAKFLLALSLLLLHCLALRYWVLLGLFVSRLLISAHFPLPVCFFRRVFYFGLPSCPKPTMQPSYSIRDATAEDVANINGLFNEAVDEGAIDWDKAQPLAFHQKWFEGLQGYPILVATIQEQGETIVAYAALEPQCKAEGTSFMFNAILHIVTRSDCRRQGIASALWNALCAHQLTYDRSVYMVIYHVLSNNEAALGLATALNFNLDGKVDKMAVKGAAFVGQIWYSFFIGSAPCCQGLGFPPEDIFSPSSSPTLSEICLEPPSFTIRDATMADLSFLVKIYNHTILNSPGTALEFWLPKTEDERRQWLQGLLDKNFPCLIAVEAGEPYALSSTVLHALIAYASSLGYLSLTPWSSHPDRSCYRHTAYISAYVRKDLKRRHVGECLFMALLKHRYVQERQIFTVIAGISQTNGPAIQGSMKAGFTVAATQSRKLVKFGDCYGAVTLRREFGPEPDLQS